MNNETMVKVLLAQQKDSFNRGNTDTGAAKMRARGLDYFGPPKPNPQAGGKNDSHQIKKNTVSDDCQ